MTSVRHASCVKLVRAFSPPPHLILRAMRTHGRRRPGIEAMNIGVSSCNVMMEDCQLCNYFWLLPPDASLTPHTLLRVLSTVRRFWGLGGLLSCLDVPSSVHYEIRDSRSYSSVDEKRTAGLQYYLQTLPGVSWGRIAGVLWFMEEHTALETVRQYLPNNPGKFVRSRRLYTATRGS